MARVELYDTTLRDGAQTEGISYSVQDKVRIARKLDEMGIHFIEAGWPANPKDREVFRILKAKPLKQAALVAFGSTRRIDKKASLDASIKSILAAETRVVTIFGKTWDLHIQEVLKISLDENLAIIHDTVKYLVSQGKMVIYDCEHFFDGYKSNPEYALKTALIAQEAGAGRIVFCDTNGGTVTSEMIRIIHQVAPKLKSTLGIHAHNDLGLAVANSIFAVENGVTHVQGTFNGYGERCGNADLTTIIGILKTKLTIECIPDKNLKELTKVSHFVSEVSNMRQQPNQPFVGSSAFVHKGGVHIDAMLKNQKTYEHIDPLWVGNHRRLLASELSGKMPIILKAKEFDLDLDKKSPKTQKILKLLQDLEHKGYQFEAADGSFEILIKRALKQYKNFFSLESFRVVVEKKPDGRITSEAIIKVKVKGVQEHTAADGDGPVNALDNALRKALKSFYPTLTKMHLSDFKVRVLDEKAGTASGVRVLIQSQDETDSWGTVGVSENIIEASWQALVDSVEYKLLKDKVS
ncbi:MAG TPA: citramalate synthase [Candidatus Omnitrophica bacterium]|nr:citramalate synthase [Candidatus Omnitrophota bacterium]